MAYPLENLKTEAYKKKYAKINLAPIPVKKGACSLLAAHSL